MFFGLILYIFFRIYSHYGSMENPTGINAIFAYVWKNHLFNVFGICNGFCYLALGMMVALTKPMTNKVQLTILFIVGVLLSIPDRNRALGLGMIPIVYVLFCQLLHNNKNISTKKTLILRQMSIVIYLMHPLIINIVSYWIPANRIDGWISILIGNVILSYCYVNLEKVKGFRWLNKLI